MSLTLLIVVVFVLLAAIWLADENWPALVVARLKRRRLQEIARHYVTESDDLPYNATLPRWMQGFEKADFDLITAFVNRPDVVLKFDLLNERLVIITCSHRRD